METAKKVKSKKKGAKTNAESIVAAYRASVLSEGKRPSSVFKFSADLGMTESEFYSYFASFDALEKSIWKGYADEVISRLSSDRAYAGFSAREKVLSFYFTLVELLRNDRSFVLYQFNEWKIKAIPPSFLKSFKSEFELWITGVIAAGKSSEEIATRPYVEKSYDNLFWMHLMFVIQFWRHDDSAEFEKTDAAIEKSVNLAFDLIGKGVLDNALDFGKFLYQNARN